MHSINSTLLCQCCHTRPIIEQQTALCARCWVARHDVLRPMPEDAIIACEAYLARAHQQLKDAKTLNDHRDARMWIDNADRNLLRWRAQLSRQVAR